MKEESIFLTFDNDWAIDEVINYSLGILKEYGIVATFHVTNRLDILSELVDSGNELGIHPNFNKDISRIGCADDLGILLDTYLDIVPNAKSVRSHSLITGTPIRQCFKSKGLVYELNTMITPNVGNQIYPWKHSDLWQIPFIFEDDVYLIENKPFFPSWYINGDFQMLKVINFHPIHVFLNTEDLNRYYSAKTYSNNIIQLYNQRNHDIHMGVEFFLRNMIETALDNGYHFKTISEWGRLSEN